LVNELVNNRVGHIRSFWKSNYGIYSIVYTADTVPVPVVPSTKDSFFFCIALRPLKRLSTAFRRPCIVLRPLRCSATLFRHIQMSVPKGMLVAAHGEAYEQHMVTVKAHHMFWTRQFQHFAAAPTHLSTLPMPQHLSSESITISQLASLDAERTILYGEASKQRWKLRRSFVHWIRKI